MTSTNQKGLYLSDREFIVNMMVDLIEFMEGKCVELLNAIYLFDQYLMLTGLNQDTRNV